MHVTNPSQAIQKPQGRDAAIQIIDYGNPLSVVMRGMAKPNYNTLIEILAPVVFAALFLSFLF